MNVFVIILAICILVIYLKKTNKFGVGTAFDNLFNPMEAQDIEKLKAQADKLELTASKIESVKVQKDRIKKAKDRILTARGLAK